MIIEINGKRIRKVKYQSYKIIGENLQELHYTDRKKLQRVNISLEYGGKLATTVGDVFGTGEKIERYEISFAKLTDDVKKQVVKAIDYIEKNGTPMENDESVFS